MNEYTIRTLHTVSWITKKIHQHGKRCIELSSECHLKLYLFIPETCGTKWQTVANYDTNTECAFLQTLTAGIPSVRTVLVHETKRLMWCAGDCNNLPGTGHFEHHSACQVTLTFSTKNLFANCLGNLQQSWSINIYILVKTHKVPISRTDFHVM
jgi:hypothetical protein